MPLIKDTPLFRGREKGPLTAQHAFVFARLRLCVRICTIILPAVAHCAVAIETTNHLRPWNDYRTIMWVGDTAYKQPAKLPLFFQRLREMGINTAMVFGDGDPQPLLDNHFPYYVENLVNRGLCLKFNSKVTDWDKFVTEWARQGRNESALVRDYCLDDPQWLVAAREQVQRIVRKNMGHNPLAYNLRDELSTTISANPFDYDFNPITLEKFREWLREHYPSLAALNTEWQTRFAAWDEVKPFTTDQIKNRMASGDAAPQGKPDWQQLQALKFDPVGAREKPTRWNFSPWADFRTYMDRSLAQSLADLRAAAKTTDPLTPVGIEGTQMPHAFGGYDLWRLSQVLDWVEPYDIGNAREIFGSFMAGKPMVTTVSEPDTNQARRRLWHLLLEGDRGCIVWWSEDCIDWKSADYALTPKARALAPALKEMCSPLARLFLRAEREYDPIFIHYSQASIQADWLLESTVDGSTWLRRFSSFEAEHNRLAKVRNGWLKAWQDLGYSPRFISSELIESGALRQSGPAVLVLPGSAAISDKELGGIKAFTSTASTSGLPREIFWDGPLGAFDEHCKLRTQWPFAELQSNAAPGAPICFSFGSGGQGKKISDITDYASARLTASGGAQWWDGIRGQTQGVSPEIAVAPTACVRVHRFRVPQGRLVAFERNINYQMSEDLKQSGGNQALEKPVELEAKLSQAQHVYDLRDKKYLGCVNRLRFTLDPWQPSLFALTESKEDGQMILDNVGDDVRSL